MTEKAFGNSKTIHGGNEFKGAGCSSPDVATECNQLINSVASFQAFPQEKKIRLQISQPLNLPLNLSLQRGTCNISCEGGYLNSCHTFVEDHYWQNVSAPIYFSNCTPQLHYCITATVGDCCPVCTETIYMEDYQPKRLNVDGGLSWNVAAAAFLVLVISIGFGAFIIRYYIKGNQSSSHWKFHSVNHVPLKEPNSDLERGRFQVTTVIFYARSEDLTFIDEVNSLQAFLRSRGLHVIDIHKEEEAINVSVHDWVQKVLENKSIKLVIIDSDLFRPLWNHNPVRCRGLRPVEQAIMYTRSCFPITDSNIRLFVVRLQGKNTDVDNFIDLGSGRQYLYPVNRERLAQDLMNARDTNEHLNDYSNENMSKNDYSEELCS